MSYIEYGIAIFLLVYFIQLAFLFFGLIKKNKQNQLSKTPFVSVVVASRDEEENIESCLNSLLKQDYPNYEIIVVNDRSVDNTLKIIEEFKNKNSRVKSVTISENNSGLTGKQNALHRGILQANGSVILSTDADCVVYDSWISNMVNAMGDRNHFVFGITKILPQNNFFQKFQGAELSVLFKIAISAVKLGVTGSCMGNNIGFTKNEYLKVGGYPDMGFKPAEDYALMRMFKKNKISIAPMFSDKYIKTKPAKTFGQWYNQHMRWLKGGVSVKEIIFWALIPVVVSNLYLPFLVIKPQSLILYLYGVKIIAELSFIFSKIQKSNVLSFVWVWLCFYLCMPIYMVLFVFTKNVKWKSETIKF